MFQVNLEDLDLITIIKLKQYEERNMRQIGKIGKINIQANKEIDKQLQEKGITTCEIKLLGCKSFMFLQRVHRHKRVWYRSKPEMLWDFKQFCLGCHNCHEVLENDKKLTEEVFLKLRGEECVS